MIADGRIPLVVERGYSSASTAYNTGLAHTTADVVLFTHQDVYLPKGWDSCLLATMDELSKKNDNWAVLGVIGRDDAGKFFGRVWSSGLGEQVGTALDRPREVGSIDELLIVLRTNMGLRFDEKLKGYHFYGTDIVRSARKTGFAAYVFDAPVVHNSVPRRQLPVSFWRAYHYMQRKWRGDLPMSASFAASVPVLGSIDILITESGNVILGRLTGFLGLQIVSPVRVAFSPTTATISPALAESKIFRSSACISNILVIFSRLLRFTFKTLVPDFKVPW